VFICGSIHEVLVAAPVRAQVLGKKAEPQIDTDEHRCNFRLLKTEAATGD
jgi:hypothetical protein